MSAGNARSPRALADPNAADGQPKGMKNLLPAMVAAALIATLAAPAWAGPKTSREARQSTSSQLDKMLGMADRAVAMHARADRLVRDTLKALQRAERQANVNQINCLRDKLRAMVDRQRASRASLVGLLEAARAKRVAATAAAFFEMSSAYTRIDELTGEAQGCSPTSLGRAALSHRCGFLGSCWPPIAYDGVRYDPTRGLKANGSFGDPRTWRPVY